MSKKVFIASDHAAFLQKKYILENLKTDLQLHDLGPKSEDSVHYPHYAISLVEHVLKNPGSRGILLCGSGIGVSIVANRFKGIRAALCRDVDDAVMSRKHNDSNVICLGGRKTPNEQSVQMVTEWLKTDFEGGRHQYRLDLFHNLGQIEQSEE